MPPLRCCRLGILTSLADNFTGQGEMIGIRDSWSTVRRPLSRHADTTRSSELPNLVSVVTLKDALGNLITSRRPECRQSINNAYNSHRLIAVMQSERGISMPRIQ